MTRNVTLRMDEELLADLRHRAVDERMSLSAWITAKLTAVARPRDETKDVRARAIRRMERAFIWGTNR